MTRDPHRELPVNVIADPPLALPRAVERLGRAASPSLIAFVVAATVAGALDLADGVLPRRNSEPVGGRASAPLAVPLPSPSLSMPGVDVAALLDFPLADVAPSDRTVSVVAPPPILTAAARRSGLAGVAAGGPTPASGSPPPSGVLPSSPPVAEHPSAVQEAESPASTTQHRTTVTETEPESARQDEVSQPASPTTSTVAVVADVVATLGGVVAADRAERVLL